MKFDLFVSNGCILGAALIATLIYKTKARKEKDQSYIEHADEFQNLAVQILERFYLTNPFECTQAIIREIPQFGNVTWLHLAVMAEAKLFIAERGVQDVLNDIWYRCFFRFQNSRSCLFN